MTIFWPNAEQRVELEEGERVLIVIPTYNEAGNVGKLLEKIFGFGSSQIEVLVVDDNSPDGTAEVVKQFAAQHSGVHLLERPGKFGLGTAYVQGFRFAMERGYDFIFEMDADLSHDPSMIPVFLETVRECDLVIGSRYLIGVNVVNWPLSRLLLSLGANWYTRLITGLPIKDCTSGYKCFRRTVLESIELDRIHSDGYSFQIEVNFKAWKKGFRIREIPIVFIDRMVGNSKMSRRVMWEAAWVVWKLKFLSLLGRL